MRTRNTHYRELLLEVVHEGHRSLVYRTVSVSGREVFVEETDLPDRSRAVSDDLGHPVYFSMKDAWTTITGFTTSEGLFRRQVWHQPASEWLGLRPAFVHPDLRPLVQRSLAQATHEAALNRSVTESIGLWLRALTNDSAFIQTGLFHPVNTYRHAS